MEHNLKRGRWQTLFSQKKAIFISIALIFGGGGAYFHFRSNKKSTIQYKKIQVVRGNISLSILSSGTVAPQNRLNIQSPIAGRAEQVLVDQGHKVRRGQVLAWVSSSERAALLDSARAQGAGELDKWEKLYRPTPIIAPVSGMVISRSIQPGQTFSTTDAILVMSDNLIVQAAVDETDIAQIQIKQPAQITLDAYPNQVILGNVSAIAYDAKTTNNVTTYEVSVLPEKVSDTMRSGMTANVNFPTGARNGVLLVPSDSIKTREGHPYVLVENPNSELPESRDVSMGVSDGKKTEIVSGLSEGETILEPEFKLEGAKDEGVNPFMPKFPKAPKGGGRSH